MQYRYDADSFSLVQCQESKEVFGIRNIYNFIFDQDSREIVFPLHKFNQKGELEETPSIFRPRFELEYALVLD